MMLGLIRTFHVWRERRQARRVTLAGARERAAAGAAFLDEWHPGWHRLLDPARMELADRAFCVLGQLHGDFRLGLSRSSLLNPSSAPRASLSPARLGFHCIQHVRKALQELDYEYLNSAWQGEIRRRREAERDVEDGSVWIASPVQVKASPGDLIAV